MKHLLSDINKTFPSNCVQQNDLINGLFRPTMLGQLDHLSKPGFKPSTFSSSGPWTTSTCTSAAAPSSPTASSSRPPTASGTRTGQSGRYYKAIIIPHWSWVGIAIGALVITMLVSELRFDCSYNVKETCLSKLRLIERHSMNNFSWSFCSPSRLVEQEFMHLWIC